MLVIMCVERLQITENWGVEGSFHCTSTFDLHTRSNYGCTLVYLHYEGLVFTAFIRLYPENGLTLKHGSTFFHKRAHSLPRQDFGEKIKVKRAACKLGFVSQLLNLYKIMRKNEMFPLTFLQPALAAGWKDYPESQSTLLKIWIFNFFSVYFEYDNTAFRLFRLFGL